MILIVIKMQLIVDKINCFFRQITTHTNYDLVKIEYLFNLPVIIFFRISCRNGKEKNLTKNVKIAHYRSAISL